MVLSIELRRNAQPRISRLTLNLSWSYKTLQNHIRVSVGSIKSSLLHYNIKRSEMLLAQQNAWLWHSLVDHTGEQVYVSSSINSDSFNKSVVSDGIEKLF